MHSSQEDFFVPMRNLGISILGVSLSVGREGGREGDGHQAIK